MSLLKLNYFTLELGDGWAPAILNIQEELDFILGAHRLSELQVYWIGGSTNNSDGSTIHYVANQYLPNSSGKNLFTKKDQFTFFQGFLICSLSSFNVFG